MEDFDDNKINIIDKDKATLLIVYNNQCVGLNRRAILLLIIYNNELKNLRVVGIHSNFGKKTTAKDIKSIFTIDTLLFPNYLDENHAVFE